MDPRSHIIRLGTGIDYHVLEWGDGDRSLTHTALLVHGFLDLAWGWAGTVEAGLAGKLHIVAPDMRGHGDSGRVSGGAYYHFMDYLPDLYELIRMLGRDQVSLVGHSMGGSICSIYAGTYPERIHRLALLEGLGPPEMQIAAPDRLKGWIEGWERARARSPRRYASLDEAAARLQNNDPLLSTQLALELAERGTSRTPDGGFAFKHDPVHVTLGPYPFQVSVAQQFWQRITCPVLAIEGAESTFRFAPEEMDRRYASFANLTRVELPGAGHMMQRHQPAALAEHLRTFLLTA